MPGAPACFVVVMQSAPESQQGWTPLVCGKGKHLPPRAAHLVWISPGLGEYEGLLDVDQRLVTDLIAATQAVADALRQ